MDKEWAKLQSQERTNAIQRAKTMMQLESPRYKTLHSQLLLYQVLYVRFLPLIKKMSKFEMKNRKEIYKSNTRTN